jgi:hypothetical protein
LLCSPLRRTVLTATSICKAWLNGPGNTVTFIFAPIREAVKDQVLAQAAVGPEGIGYSGKTFQNSYHTDTYDDIIKLFDLTGIPPTMFVYTSPGVMEEIHPPRLTTSDEFAWNEKPVEWAAAKFLPVGSEISLQLYQRQKDRLNEVFTSDEYKPIINSKIQPDPLSESNREKNLADGISAALNALKTEQCLPDTAVAASVIVVTHSNAISNMVYGRKQPYNKKEDEIAGYLSTQFMINYAEALEALKKEEVQRRKEAGEKLGMPVTPLDDGSSAGGEAVRDPDWTWATDPQQGVSTTVAQKGVASTWTSNPVISKEEFGPRIEKHSVSGETALEATPTMQTAGDPCCPVQSGGNKVNRQRTKHQRTKHQRTKQRTKHQRTKHQRTKQRTKHPRTKHKRIVNKQKGGEQPRPVDVFKEKARKAADTARESGRQARETRLKTREYRLRQARDERRSTQKAGEYSSKPPPGGGMKFTFEDDGIGFEVKLDILNPSDCCDLDGGKQMISEILYLFYKRKEVTMEILKKMMPHFKVDNNNIQ